MDFISFLSGSRYWLKQSEMCSCYYLCDDITEYTLKCYARQVMFDALGIFPEQSEAFLYQPLETDLQTFREILRFADKQLAQKEKQREKDSKPKWTVEKQSSCFWIKIYAEQVGYVPPIGTDVTDGNTDRKTQSTYLETFLHRVVEYILYTSCKIHGIVHDSLEDCLLDDFGNPSPEKPHAHILFWFPAGVKMRFKALVNVLQKCGLVWREEDLQLWHDSTMFPDLRQKQQYRAVVYHTHETEQASEKEGKPLYSRLKCVHNFPPSELEEIYSTYFSELYHAKSTREEQNSIILHCGELGQKCADWIPYFDSLPLSVRTDDKLEKKCKREFERGQKRFLESPEARAIVRCSIFIHGVPNAGKTYNSETALSLLTGKPVLKVGTSGNGKLDDIRPIHGSILVDDTSAGDSLLAMADMGAKQLYRRVSNNAFWTGTYLVITYNSSLDEYIDNFYYGEDKKAIRSRFFETEIVFDSVLGHYQLKYDMSSTKLGEYRGGLYSQLFNQRLQMLKAFLDAFNRSELTYFPDSAVSSKEVEDEILKIFAPSDLVTHYEYTIPPVQPGGRAQVQRVVRGG